MACNCVFRIGGTVKIPNRKIKWMTPDCPTVYSSDAGNHHLTFDCNTPVPVLFE
jgi:hypothetical protein